MSRWERELDRVRQAVVRPVAVEGDGRRPERVPAVELLLRRCRKVFHVAAAGSARPDGFPSRSSLSGSPGSGKGARMQMRVDGDDGPDWLATSSTELAAVAAAEARNKIRDPYLGQARELVPLLERLVRTVHDIEAVCDRFDRLRDTAPVEDAPQCHVARVVHGLQWDDTWSPWRSTTFAGVLAQPWPEERPVCRWVYDFTRAHRRLPERSEMLDYLRRGYVRVRDGSVSR